MRNTSTLSESVMELLSRYCGHANKDLATKRGNKMSARGTLVTLTDVTAPTSGTQRPAIDMTTCYMCEQWAWPETDDDDAWLE